MTYANFRPLFIVPFFAIIVLFLTLSTCRFVLFLTYMVCAADSDRLKMPKV